MNIILEKSLDFKQFQNLFILTFVSVMFFLVMINSVEFKSYATLKYILFILIIIFTAILFTKKGLSIDNQNLYRTIFLFGFVLRKTQIQVTGFQKLSLAKGRLTTNYIYSYNIKEFHNWEPALNHSEKSFTLFALNEKENSKQKILMLTKVEKVKLAIEFIIKNTALKFN